MPFRLALLASVAVLLAGLTLPASLAAAPSKVFFAPSATDPAITQFDQNHYAVVDPAIPARGRLVVFLPGTGAVPFIYREFIENAASLGFHALGLNYPNPVAINELTLNDPRNPAAAGEARLEVFDGTDRVSYLTIDRVNSIENRLLKALQYLATQFPTQGWGQYFSGNAIVWERLIVSGHSQGAGHAGRIAKVRPLAGCAMFASVDFWISGGRPYDWVSEASQTPLHRWFLLAHERDELLPFPNVQQGATALALDRYGAVVRVENATAPYGGRHFLSTNLEPARGASGSYHATVVADVDTPRVPGGTTPLLKPVWDLMLTSDIPESRLINVSTRAPTATGDNVLIAGFAIRQGPKKVAVRALGPSLTPLGVPNALANPVLELYGAGGLLQQNDDWAQGVSSAVAELTQRGLAPTQGSESALLLTLPAGNYTAIVRGVGGGTGNCLVEVYDLETALSPTLVNLSTRAPVGQGDSVMIAGFVVSGPVAKKVLVRALGPSLAGVGVPGVLLNPRLQLFRGPASLAANDDWRSTQAAEITAAGLAPTDDRESALLVTLEPGAYTAIVSGRDQTGGNAIVEVYELLGGG